MNKRTQSLLFCVIVSFIWTVEGATQEVVPINGDNELFMVFREVVLTVFHHADSNSVKFVNATSKSAINGSEVTILTLEFPPTQGSVKISKFDLTLTFKKGKLGYWAMTNQTVVLEGSDSAKFTFPVTQLSTAIDISVPVDMSFHCTRFGSLYPTDKKEDLKQNHTFTIDIKGFQMQVFTTKPQNNRFLDAYECVGFFTPGIWSGIVITLILLSILTWGMKMIMDVKTMDRFDDPKGKPVSFGSGE